MFDAESEAPAIELIGIDKSFGPVHANKNVNLKVAKGVIHGIVGENGAGKSTLMSILYGFYEADAGEIRVNGKTVRIRSSREAIDCGIGMVHQHFMLVSTLTVLENVMLGAEGGALLAKGAARIRKELARLGKEYALDVDPDAIVGELSVGLQQRVEILKALVRGAEILVLDEPTAVLTPSEADQLFEMLRVLERQQKTIVFITHKLREIMSLTDRVSVMRRGEMVATFETVGNLAARTRRCDGRAQGDPEDRQGAGATGQVVLEARNLEVRDDRGVVRVHDVSFALREGEILGVAGVAGNGQSELLEALAGMRPISVGEIRIDGRALTRMSAILQRCATSASGTCPRIATASASSCRSRRAKARCSAFTATGFLAARCSIGEKSLRGGSQDGRLDVRPRDPLLKTANFSGGNQQKLVLAREIDHQPRIMLVGQPTRGVDIGAIEFIHRRIVAERDAGKAVFLVSVELDEIFSLSDRIIVLCAGRVTGERRPEETNPQDLGLLMAGVAERAASVAEPVA